MELFALLRRHQQEEPEHKVIVFFPTARITGGCPGLEGRTRLHAICGPRCMLRLPLRLPFSLPNAVWSTAWPSLLH